MNRISFSGSHSLVRDFYDRFLDRGPGIFEPLEETTEFYGSELRRIAASTGARIESLERVVDFLVASEIPDEEIDDLLTGDEPGVLALARDVDTLQRYQSDGTILDVRLTGEPPGD